MSNHTDSIELIKDSPPPPYDSINHDNNNNNLNLCDCVYNVIKICDSCCINFYAICCTYITCNNICHNDIPDI